ncbi:MAG: hydantoinase/oxoprolinase family protein, partial [Aestuariivirgaceae bacterium]
KAYVRYVGQGWEIPVELAAADIEAPQSDRLLALFEEQYASLFARTVAGLDVEVTSWSITAATPAPAAEPVVVLLPDERASGDTSRQLFDPVNGGYVAAMAIERANLAAGHYVEGPAVITEAETTIIVPSGFTATAQADGSIDVVRSVREETS